MSAITLEIERLAKQARTGDESAIRELFHAGAAIVEATEAAWESPSFSHNPFATQRSHERWRLIFTDIARELGFLPTLAEIAWDRVKWDQSTKRIQKWNPAQRREKRDLAEIIRGHQLAGRGQLGMARWFMLNNFIPRVKEARCGIRYERPLAKLPPLSESTASQWAKAAESLVWGKKRDEIRVPGTDWNLMAGGGRKSFKRKLKEKKSTTSRMVRGISKNDSPEKASIRKLYRDKAIESQQPTDGDLRDGMYQTFLKVLLNLHPNTAQNLG